MASQFISPGVFTQVNDLSFLPQGIATIGGAFIGPTQEGPAFVPTLVTSPQDFINKFGQPNPNFYAPYAVLEYLKNAAQARVVRVLGLSGYDSTINKSAILFISGNGGTFPLAVIHPTQNAIAIGFESASGTPASFQLFLSGADASVTGSGLSAFSTSSTYFGQFLGYGPTGKNEGWTYAQFPAALNAISGGAAGSGSIFAQDSAGRLNFSGSIYGVYTNASTPIIRSQTIGATRYNLFQIFGFDSGIVSNGKVKISIINTRPDPLGLTYGTFGIQVRAFGDTDTSPVILEEFDNLTLNPNDANYIARRIGDTHPVINTTTGDVYFDGNYQKISQYIYVSMDSGINNVPFQALPYGFMPLFAPVQLPNVPAPTYISTRYTTPVGTTVSVPNNSLYYGYNFTDLTSLSYLTAVPSGALQFGGEFNLENVVDTDVSGNFSTVSSMPFRKFTIPLQDGFDGLNPARVFGVGTTLTPTNTQGFDLSTAASAGTIAYQLAINTVSNPDAIDINLITAPGVLYQYHPYVATLIMNLCVARGDCFYIMDNQFIDSTVTQVITNVQGIDNNVTATYHPWVKILDINLNKTVWVPPSVLLPSVFAFNDKVGAEWYAPAGLNRGGLTSALGIRARLTHDDRDSLYSGHVNPIAVFPNQGIVVWGQKTLQADAGGEISALDRINVARLLIATKKFIASAARYLVFEQNVDATRQRFLSIVNPYLASVQERNGLYAFKVVMDSTNNTPDLIDRNILVGQLYLQPTRTAEFISLQFNILPTGTTFNG